MKLRIKIEQIDRCLKKFTCMNFRLRETSCTFHDKTTLINITENTYVRVKQSWTRAVWDFDHVGVIDSLPVVAHSPFDPLTMFC